jgi:hypothetical protein
MARDNEIETALSNPCFELWLVLHLRESPGMQGRNDLIRLMRKHIDGHDKHVDFTVYEGGYESAVARARRLDADAQTDEDIGRNPTTGVYRLTESIRMG